MHRTSRIWRIVTVDEGQTIPTSDLDELIADTNDAAAWHQRGDFLNSAGQFELAIEDYSRALELDPNSHWSILNRGHCYFKNGTSDQAIVAAQAAKELALTDPKYQAHLCSLLELTRQFAPALEIANRLVELQPNSVDPIRRRANIYCQLKEYEKGIADYEKALKIKPKNQRLRLARLGALAANGQAESSRKELNKLIAEANKPGQVLVDFGLAIHRAGLVEQMEWAVEKAAEFGTGTESIMYYNLGCGHALAGDTDRAFAALKRSIELGESRAEMFTNDTDLIRIRDDPRFEELQAMLKWAGPYEAGLQNEKDGNMAVAIEDFTKAIDINPQCGRIHNRRGLAYYRTGKFKPALDDFSRFVELRPGDALAWCNRAAAQLKLGQLEPTLADATTAIELDSNYPPAFRLRGQGHMALKNWQAAVADFSRLIDLEPDKTANHLDRGNVYLLMGDKDKTAADFDVYLAPYDEQVQGNPENWENLNQRGVARTKTQRWDSAIEDFSQAIGLTPTESVLWSNRAFAYCQLSDWPRAAADLTRSLGLNSSGWRTHYELALAQLGAGDLLGYRQTCQRMAAAFADTTDPLTANFVAWTCVIGPNALDDWEPVLKLARFAIKAEATLQNQNTLGILLMRSGQSEEAIRLLLQIAAQMTEPDSQPNTSPAYTWYALSLAYQQCNENRKAREYLEKANSLTNLELADRSHLNLWNRRLTLELFREEASTAVGNEESTSLDVEQGREWAMDSSRISAQDKK